MRLGVILARVSPLKPFVKAVSTRGSFPCRHENSPRCRDRFDFYRSTLCRVNENPEIIETSGYIFPCWLIVSNSSAVDVPGLDAAKSSAVFKRWLAPGTNGIASVNQRETTVVLPVPVVGRYVRIQRQDSQYLSIAEVEVFSERTWLLCLCLPVFFHILTAVVFVCERFRVCNHVQLPWRITRCFSNFPA
jgi:hypothetical protein